MPVIRRTWTPHSKQRAILNDTTRFRIVAAGRRFGKTEMALHALFEFAIRVDGAMCWYVAPTYGDANELGYDPMVRIIPEALMAGEPKRTPPRKIHLINGSEISFRSGEREDSLRGRGLDYLVIDEAGSVPDRSWKSELRPSLADYEAPMLAIGTPRGEGWFKEWFHRGMDEQVSNTESFRGTSYDNPHVSDEEVEQMRSELPERVFKQEVLAEFLTDEGAVFGNVRERNIAEYDMESERNRSDGPFTIGIDLARKRNFLAVIALNEAGRIVAYRRDRGGSWGRLQGVMEGVLDGLYPGTVYMDASRDNAVIQDLDRATSQKIESVSFGGGTKNDLIENLAARLEIGEIQIPGHVIEGARNEPIDAVQQLITELEAYQFETTQAGNITYGPPASVHDDLVDALALAAQRPKVTSATW